jgi:phthalate 4,5-cis-dihydrodiol dehydrogenase
MASPATTCTLNIGVVGLGRGFMLMAPTLRTDPRCRLVAAADPRPAALARFAAEFGGRGYGSAEELCADPAVDVVYIASPHQHHAHQAVAAARAGKHVLVEKPMALDLDQCAVMVAAARKAGTFLVVGPSHGFDAPVAQAAALIASGAYGAVRMVSALNYTDFLFRPRRPEELDTAQGGGVVFSQAAHQVDVVRRLVGAPVARVRAQVGAWDPARPADGAYTAFLTFEGGAAATLTYSGYGRFDSDELMGWIGETGRPKDPAAYGAARRRLAEASSETDLKTERTYGAAGAEAAPAAHHEHFGPVIVSCEHADLRPTADGVIVHADRETTFHPAPPPTVPRQGVIDELWGAVVDGRPPLHSGEWGLANLEVCLAILRSSAEGREIDPRTKDLSE